MIPAARDALGRLYIINAAPPASAPRMGGFALSDLGQIYIDSVNNPVVFTNGFGFNAGRLCVSLGGAQAIWREGLPFTLTGRLFAQLNTTPVTGWWRSRRGYCRRKMEIPAAVRTTRRGGVYMIDTVPAR